MMRTPESGTLAEASPRSGNHANLSIREPVDRQRVKVARIFSGWRRGTCGRAGGCMAQIGWNGGCNGPLRAAVVLGSADSDPAADLGLRRPELSAAGAARPGCGRARLVVGQGDRKRRPYPASFLLPPPSAARGSHRARRRFRRSHHRAASGALTKHTGRAGTGGPGDGSLWLRLSARLHIERAERTDLQT